MLLNGKIVPTKANQNFRGYLPQHFWKQLQTVGLNAQKSPATNAAQLQILGFHASLLKLLPELLLIFLIEVLSEAGTSDNFSLLPYLPVFKKCCYE